MLIFELAVYKEVNMKYTKICPICKKSFETNKSYKIYCDNDHYLPCPICGKPVLKTDKDFSRPPKCCSSKCSHELRKRHFKPRKCVLCGDWFIPTSGINTVCQKTHYRNCEICGKPFEYSLADNPDQTICSHECAIEKQKRNSLKKYGTEHPMQSDIVQKHHRESMMRIHGVEFALQKKEFVQKQQQTVIKTNMKSYGVPYACMLPQCAEAQGKILSKTNLEFIDNLRSHGIDCIYEKRLGNYCFDVCIESEKIVIEIDPTYTHNCLTNHYGQVRDKYYHRDKSKCAENNGYRCIHIFDWDDKNKIISMLSKNKKHMYAKDLKIYKLNPKIGNEFLNRYHLKGSCYGQLLYLGLVKDNTLYQIMTFGKSRYNKNYNIELLRFCSIPDYQIVGGASKLFKFATDYFELNSIISYCDLSKFRGDVYTKLGMQLHHITPPSKTWSKNTQRITDSLLAQKGYNNLFHTNADNNTSDIQHMINDGWLPVYDCGQAVYVYDK